MREDGSPEAEFHRQRVRAEILQRARVLRERQTQLEALEVGMRGTKQPPQRQNTTSFDDFVDLEGKLKREEEEQAASSGRTVGVSSAARHPPSKSGMRKRKANADVEAKLQDKPPTVLSGSLLDATEAVLPALPAPIPFSPCIDSNARRTLSSSSSHSSQHNNQLTPLTSRAPSTFRPSDHNREPSTPTRGSLEEERSQPQSPTASGPPPPPTDFRSVHEWAENSTASFYSPPQSARGASPVEEEESGGPSFVASVIGSNDAMSEAEIVSEIGSALHTPDTWTEVGSVTSQEQV